MEAKKQEHHDLIDNVEESKADSRSVSKPAGHGIEAYIDSISDEILIGSS